eukprot:gb/GEZJ01003506.1/.p3 GENE.gb/GEZJ01003506.1/~~gb/GEZJ01003506.1/.p3  ORF type:complete len:109 (-),score=6.69 gb/GEZJ01003506.1/:2703-3029(-)
MHLARSSTRELSDVRALRLDEILLAMPRGDGTVHAEWLRTCSRRHFVRDMLLHFWCRKIFAEHHFRSDAITKRDGQSHIQDKIPCISALSKKNQPLEFSEDHNTPQNQ